MRFQVHITVLGLPDVDINSQYVLINWYTCLCLGDVFFGLFMSNSGPWISAAIQYLSQHSSITVLSHPLPRFRMPVVCPSPALGGWRSRMPCPAPWVLVSWSHFCLMILFLSLRPVHVVALSLPEPLCPQVSFLSSCFWTRFCIMNGYVTLISWRPSCCLLESWGLNHSFTVQQSTVHFPQF